ncbi:fasciclin domain-containing protein [Brevundimonas sp.]|uniref:fasciclin domain-containing protein n=1 Tax=Brevundimonas sp. TaxID=1871086 RepID=UPI0035625121
MFRIRLMTAAAATALLAAAPAAFAQDTRTAPVDEAPMTSPVQTPPMAPVQTPTPPVTAQAEAAADAAVATPAVANSVIDVLKERGEFTTLLAALDQAQLTETLASRPAITVFAPTDAAFAAVPEAERMRLMDPANAQELRNLLLYHVIVSDVTTAQITGAAGAVETAGGVKVQIDGSGEGIKVDEAMASAEIDAGNGAVFPIDKILNPAQSGASMGDEEGVTPPAAATTTAPSGEQAVTTTTTAAPPVPNPTDGQVDVKPGEAEEPKSEPQA